MKITQTLTVGFELFLFFREWQMGGEGMHSTVSFSRFYDSKHRPSVLYFISFLSSPISLLHWIVRYSYPLWAQCKKPADYSLKKGFWVKVFSVFENDSQRSSILCMTPKLQYFGLNTTTLSCFVHFKWCPCRHIKLGEFSPCVAGRWFDRMISGSKKPQNVIAH